MLLTTQVLWVSGKIYGALLVMYPAQHRREYGALMVQVFRDQCRDAKRQGGLLGFILLWINTLIDLATSAIQEHMNQERGSLPQADNNTHTPLPWQQVGLAILPGLFTLSITSGVLKWIAGNNLIWRAVGVYGLAIACVALTLAGIHWREFAVWSLPALGVVIYSTVTLSAFPLLLQPGIHSLALSAAIGALAVATLIYQRRHIPMVGWLFLGVAIMAGAGGAVSSIIRFSDLIATEPFWHLWYLMPLAIFLPSTAIGLRLARQHGLLAGMIVTAAEFALYLAVVGPGLIFMSAWTRATTSVFAACFLVWTPVWVLRSRSTFGRARGLLVPPMIALVWGQIYNLAIASADPYGNLTSLIFNGVFLTTLIPDVVIYYWIEREKQARPENPEKESLSHSSTLVTAAQKQRGCPGSLNARV